jgi:hemerythrin superfamily protein
MNAHDLLKQDHRKVKDLFQRFEDSEDDQTKQSIANQVVRELEVHTRIEEEIYYPAVREQGEQEMIQEAEEEHNLADILAGQLAGMEAPDPEFDAKFTVLAESVSHHIDEEEGEMFPKVEDKLGEDKLSDLGQRMAQRKEELMEEVEGMPQEFEEEARPAARRTTSGRTTRSTRGRSTSSSRGRGRSR